MTDKEGLTKIEQLRVVAFMATQRGDDPIVAILRELREAGGEATMAGLRAFDAAIGTPHYAFCVGVQAMIDHILEGK